MASFDRVCALKGTAFAIAPEQRGPAIQAWVDAAEAEEELRRAHGHAMLAEKYQRRP